MRPEDTDIPYIAVDLDDTLAVKIWPDRGIGAPIKKNIAKLRELVEEGWTPVIHTARPWSDYDDIRVWMAGQGFPGIRVVCGKFLAERYIDDKAINAEAESWTP